MTGLKKPFQLLIIVSLCILMDSAFFGEVYNVANSKASICILSYETEFKKNLITALVQEFNAEEMSVTVDTVSNGMQYSPENYNAVILLSAVQAFGPLPKTVEYIKKYNYSPNIVYFATYSMFNFPYGSLDKKKIDAITSASVTNDNKAFEEVKNKIIAKTMEVLNKK